MGRRDALLRHARGPLVVAVGAGVLGVCSYAYLTVAARTLGPAEFGELSTLWALVFGLVAGLWYPFEQESSRLVAAAGGRVSAADLRRVALVQGAVLVAAEILLLVLAPRVGGVGEVPGVLLALLLSTVALALSGLQRGVLVGASRFGWAAVQQSVDGVARAGGALACALTGASLSTFALVLAVSPFVGALAALPGTPRRPTAGPATRDWSRVLRDLGALAVGTSSAIILLNVGPLVVRVLADAEATGRFMAVFVVARLPLFFAGAVVSGLMPSLVATSRSNPDAYGRTALRLLAVVGAVLVPACLLLGALAPWVSRTFFGSAYDAPLGLSLLLALSSALLLVALVAQAALVADDRQQRVAIGWLSAVAAFAVALLVPVDPATRVALAYVAAGVVGVAVMGLSLRGAGRRSSAAVGSPT